MVIGVADSVEPSRSVPRSDGEALVLRLLGRAGEIRPCAAAGEIAHPGSWQVSEAGPGRLALRREPPSEGPVLAVVIQPGSDPRTLLDGHADIVVTRDARTVDYASGLGGYESLPLSWDRIYVLAAPEGSAALAIAVDGDDWSRSVRGESRRPVGGAWWEARHCRGGESSAAGLGLRFAAGDATAGDLAERIVALGARRGLPLTPSAVEPTSVDGGPTIVALPAMSPSSCAGVPPIPSAWRVIPLVETRARVISRRGAATLVADPDGGVRIAAPRADTAGTQPRAAMPGAER